MLHYISSSPLPLGLGKQAAEEKHFTSCPTALDNCLSRHREKSTGPRAQL